MPSPRVHRAAVTAVIGLLGAFIVLAGLQSETFACERARGVCEWTRGALRTTTREVAVAQIRDRRFERSRSRNGARGVTVLLDARGAELRIAADDEDAAEEKFTALARFLDGEGDRVTLVTGPSPLMLVFGALFMLGAVVVWRTSPAGAPAPAPAPASAPRSRALVVGLAIAALAIAGVVAAAVVAGSQGTLALNCVHRCEVAGLTCVAGSATSMTLPPGEHEVRVFTPDAPGSWTSRRVTLARGQVTNFTCAP